MNDMTYKELLDSVSFEEIVPYIEKYHGSKGCLALYKIHYDMLRHLTPKHHDDANDDVCHITMEKNDNGRGFHLDAYPMEGDLWEHSLTKELIIAPDVKATNAELAACCLWHTSFYGFTEEQVDDRCECLEFYSKDYVDSDITRIRAKRVIRALESAGGKIPSVKEYMKIPSFRNKIRSKCKEFKSRRKAFTKAGTCSRSMRSYAHHIIRKEYYKRIWRTGDVIRAMLKSSMTHVEDIRSLLLCNHMQSYVYKTQAYDSRKRVEWMKELIDKYEAFNMTQYKNCIVCIGTSSAYPFRIEEASIIECIVSRCSGINTFYVYTDDNLEQDMRVTTVFYE